jgi:hypothetical protein
MHSALCNPPSHPLTSADENGASVGVFLYCDWSIGGKVDCPSPPALYLIPVRNVMQPRLGYSRLMQAVVLKCTMYKAGRVVEKKLFDIFVARISGHDD